MIRRRRRPRRAPAEEAAGSGSGAPSLAEALPAGCTFSADTALVDRDLVHHWLSTGAYWAQGRSRTMQDAAIDGSMNFGVYDHDGRQLAYARLVTDRATFGWLADVYVDPSERGRGVGVALIAGVAETVDAMGLRRTVLVTNDAQGLYAKFGFAHPDDPTRWMLRGAR
ncbi:GNAT family N-acetyltransferase [Agromyces seonyuensis]|uniref:GNAT family N-acetyltransferase n=1 Tax=Agromyces seonyuensis TaxID=2662446 RepID=A0A6I4NXS5_9MICO|nr:GNAT family N-acetyltransferase [Agromyces seonyuensis]MWB99083.1 GNAT family N-acetyltransferase [Agromyces seonyuensis]